MHWVGESASLDNPSWLEMKLNVIFSVDWFCHSSCATAPSIHSALTARSVLSLQSHIFKVICLNIAFHVFISPGDLGTLVHMTIVVFFAYCVSEFYFSQCIFTLPPSLLIPPIQWLDFELRWWSCFERRRLNCIFHLYFTRLPSSFSLQLQCGDQVALKEGWEQKATGSCHWQSATSTTLHHRTQTHLDTNKTVGKAYSSWCRMLDIITCEKWKCKKKDWLKTSQPRYVAAIFQCWESALTNTNN